jgi:hypothetical protein
MFAWLLWEIVSKDLAVGDNDLRRCWFFLASKHLSVRFFYSESRPQSRSLRWVNLIDVRVRHSKLV